MCSTLIYIAVNKLVYSCSFLFLPTPLRLSSLLYASTFSTTKTSNNTHLSPNHRNIWILKLPFYWPYSLVPQNK